MRSHYSEEHYRQNWERLIKKSNNPNYINLEAELADRMSIYKGIPSEALETIRHIEAEKIAETCKVLVMKQMETVKELESGKASLGYTTKFQEVQAMHEIVERFEFNCLQLADFKKKYITA